MPKPATGWEPLAFSGLTNTSVNASPAPLPSPLQSPSPSPSPSQSQSPSPLPPSVLRLWRPAAQRNLRNQWSKLAAHKQKWFSLSSSGRSYATELVNSYLSQKYLDSMDLGVLSDMPAIQKKARLKLSKKQDLYGNQLLSAYRNLVAVAVNMVNTGGSMRCFSQGASGSPLIQFSSSSVGKSDTGDGGGVPVVTFWPILKFEELAQELVEMFKMELIMKRLLVVGLLCIDSATTVKKDNPLSWSDELYPGETDDLNSCGLLCEGMSAPPYPKVEGRSSCTDAIQLDNKPERDVLQVYLTTWLSDVNIDTDRVDEIFAVAGEEIHTNFLI